MSFFQAMIIVGIVIITLLLYKILASLEGVKGFLIKFANSKQGLYPAYTLQEITEVNASRAKAFEQFYDSGGLEKLSKDSIKESIMNGKSINDIILEANHQIDVQMAWEKAHDRHTFLLQANIDALRGAKNINDIYEEERDRFYGIGISPTIYDKTRGEKKNKMEEWIRENYETIKKSIV